MKYVSYLPLTWGWSSTLLISSVCWLPTFWAVLLLLGVELFVPYPYSPRLQPEEPNDQMLSYVKRRSEVTTHDHTSHNHRDTFEAFSCLQTADRYARPQDPTSTSTSSTWCTYAWLQRATKSCKTKTKKVRSQPKLSTLSTIDFNSKRAFIPKGEI